MDSAQQEDSSDFTSIWSIQLLDEWIDDFSNLLFLISLILCLKLSKIDMDKGNWGNHHWKGRESVHV